VKKSVLENGGKLLWKNLIRSQSCITITAEFSQNFLMVYEDGKSSFTGSRMINIILVLPYILRDLVAQPSNQQKRTILYTATLLWRILANHA